LIYDFGLHNGGDTAHYLQSGARVVAVEANPTMCAAVEEKFGDYIRNGQLTVINRGLGEHAGQMEFWVSDDDSEWSSFDRSNVSRLGSRYHAITVDCIPIVDIIAEFGVPDYMKIDLEGHDRVCIAGLTQATAPRYISIEMDHEHGDRDIRRLADLGYRDFKLICQNDGWHQITTRNLWLYERLAADDLASRSARKLRKLASRGIWKLRTLADGRHGLPVGPSGPWGERTSGSWCSVEHSLAIWHTVHDLDNLARRSGADWWAWWFDVHARKDASIGSPPTPHEPGWAG
jgi:FkbM family methyltransferase